MPKNKTKQKIKQKPVVYKDIETGVRYSKIPPGYRIADSKGKEVSISKELVKNGTLDTP